MRKQRFLVALVCLVGLIPTLSASAQSEPTLDVRAGFDGYYKPSGWVPVSAVVANQGADIDGEIRIPAQETWGNVAYTQPALLPKQSRKRFTLYALVGYNARELTVRLVDGEKTLAEQRVRLEPVDDQSFLYGIVSDDPAALSYLAGLRPPNNRRVHIAHLSLLDLPTQAGAMTGLDMLVLDSVDTSTLSDEQRDALRGWVGMGGHLIICGGPNAALTAAGLGDLLPAVVQGTVTTTDLADLGEYAQAPFTGSIPAVVAQVSQIAPDAQILAGTADRALLIHRTVGAGRIDYMALDPNLAPMRTWIGNDSLWPKLTFTAPLSERLGQNQVWSSLSNAAANIPSLDVPSVFLVVGFMFLYVIVVGPLNLLVLKLLDRRSWAWITVPALIAVFSCVAIVAGFVSRGRRAIVSQVSVVRAHLESQTAILESFAGLYSPSRRAYDARLPDNVLVRNPSALPYGMGGPPAGRLAVQQGPPTLVRDVEVDVGAMRGFSMSTVRQWSEVEVNLTLLPIQPSGYQLQGTIANKGSGTIEDCVLLYQSQLVHIPDLAPGETQSISAAFQPSTSLPAYRLVEEALGSPSLGALDRRERARRNSVLSYALQGLSGPTRPGISEPTLIGWLSDNPLPVSLVGVTSVTHATTLLIAPLPISSADQGVIVLSPGALSWAYLGTGPARSPHELYVGPTTEVFAFSLPPEAQGLPIERLVLHADPLYEPAYGNPPAMWLKRAATGQWEEVSQPRWGANTVSDAQRFVDGTGTIELKVDTSTIEMSLSVDFSATLQTKQE